MGEIADRFRMPKGTVQNILRRHSESDSIEPKAHAGGRSPAFSSAASAKLEKALTDRPDSTLEELRMKCGVQVSLVSYHNALKRLGYTRKKSLYVRESSAGRT